MLFRSIMATALILFAPIALSGEKMLINPVESSERVFVVENNYYYLENSVVYLGEEEIILLGATWSPKTAELLHNKIKSRFDKPVTAVVNTNYHPDRAGGNAYWRQQGVDIYSTQKTYDLMEKSFVPMVEKMKKVLDGYPDVPLVLPNKILQEKDDLLNGNIETLYLGESHSPDGIMVYMPNERVLYASCILKRKIGNLSDANISEYPNTLRKLKSLNLNVDTIIAGHDEAVNPPSLVDHYLDLLSNVE